MSYQSFPVSIGRATCCDYNLSDASRYISSNHASVTEERGSLILHDSSYNGVYINDSIEPVGKGNSSVLENGDTLAIGDYILAVEIDANSGTTDSFSDERSRFSTSPLDDDSYDPFRVTMDWTSPSEKNTALPDTDNVFKDSRQNIPVVESNDVTDWANWDQMDSEIFPETPSISSNPSPAGTFVDDIDVWPTVESNDAKSAETPTAETPTARTTGEYQTPTDPVESSQNQTQRDAEQNEIALNTFLKSAGLNPDDFRNLNEAEAMEQVGVLLNHAVDGIMQLLQSRNEIKKTVRADVTLIARKNNNPLKFSFSTEEALESLLLPDTGKGHQNSSEAIREAVDDLKIHQVAMLEGMKVAVHEILKQFDPENLEQRLDKTNSIMTNIPLTRNSKLWQMFQERYGDIREEAESDFKEFFGKEFRRAYERRSRELGKEPDF